MKVKTIVVCMLMPLVAGSVGLWLGVGALAEIMGEPEKLRESGENPAVTENRRLRTDIREAQRRISLLEEKFRQAKKAQVTAAAVKKTTLLPKASAVDSPELAALKAKIAKALQDIKLLKGGELELNEEQIAARIAEIRKALEKALADSDGEGILSALAALAKLGEPAYPELIKIWKELNEAGWPGVGRRARFGMGWADKDLYSWALTSKSLGVDSETTRKFQGSAVMALRFVEPNASKRVKTYSVFLSNQPAPAPLTKEQKSLTGMGRFFSLMEDPYRGAVMQVSRTKDPESTGVLSGIVSDQDVPSDVKAMALTGLAKQDGAEAEQAIDSALSDPDEDVQKAAEMAKQLSNPPVSGFFIYTVGDGPLKKQGVAPGDIMLTYNGATIHSMRDLFFLPGQAETETVEIQIYSGGQTKKLTVKTDEDLAVMGEYVQGPSSGGSNSKSSGSSSGADSKD
jgi:hypothetical protein